MAHLRRIGFFFGTDFSSDKKIWASRIPLTQQQAEQNILSGGFTTNPYQNPNALPTLLGLARMMAMPFLEYMDFVWRVKLWQFSSSNTLLAESEYPDGSIGTELELHTGFGFTGQNPGGQSAYGFVNTYQVACPPGGQPGQVCSRVCWLIWSNATAIAFGPAELQNRNDQYINLSYAPVLGSQSFAGPTEIIKTGYLTFDVVFNSPFSSATQPVTVSISPAEWWTYGGRYSAATGAEL